MEMGEYKKKGSAPEGTQVNLLETKAFDVIYFSHNKKLYALPFNNRELLGRVQNV